MRYHFYTADVFTDRSFGGNQLAVLPDARGLDDEQMQAVAREFNHSESVFVLPPEDPAHTRRVRIFTPGAEVPFAGHPTVGTAFVLATAGHVPVREGHNQIVLEEGVGPVSVRVEVVEGRAAFCQLTAARAFELIGEAPSPSALAGMLSLEAGDIGDAGYAAQFASCGLPFLYVPVADVHAVERARLNLDRWESVLTDAPSDLVYVFALGGSEGVEVHARMFAPSMGVPEDPATGSAATSLAGYLATHSGLQDGTLRWVVEQGLEMGRPSLLHAEADLAAGVVTATRVGGRRCWSPRAASMCPDRHAV